MTSPPYRIVTERIHTEPGTERSMRIPQKLGYVEEARCGDGSTLGPGEPRDTVVFSMFRSPAASVQLEAYDALGERVL